MLSVTAAVALAAQPRISSIWLYQTVRERILNDISKLPNYTCVETITRRNYIHPKKVSSKSRCSDLLSTADLKLVSWDRLRLDVAIADRHEVYSWVGASKFESDDLYHLIGYGQTAKGEFGPFLLAVFGDHPTLDFGRERNSGGSMVYEYQYVTPAALSHWEIRIGADGYRSSSFNTPYSGSIVLDVPTRDLVRLEARSAELPANSGYCESSVAIDYSRVSIRDTDVLIPAQARFTATDRDGDEQVSENEYSNCHEYVGESVLKFDGTDTQERVPDSLPQEQEDIPAGLSFDARITTAIDSEHTAAGDPIEGVLRTPIRAQDGHVLVPAGSRLYGRLVNFFAADLLKRPYFELGIQFKSIDVGSRRAILSADLITRTSLGRSGPTGNVRPGVGRFIFYSKGLHLPQLEATWITVAQR